MKIIEQSSNIWGKCPSDKQEAIEWIEKAGRVCYRSEDKIVPGSGFKFVDNIWKRGHFSVIEHSNCVLRTIEKSKFPSSMMIGVKSAIESNFLDCHIHEDRVYISGNWRAWLEWHNHHEDNPMNLDTFPGPDNYMYERVSGYIPNECHRITVEFITNRAMTHELVRHRIASFSQESQRYVNYRDGIEFVTPLQNMTKFAYTEFLNSCEYSETKYKNLLMEGCKPQLARNVLPNATATKIIVTASMREWWHIFNLRCSKAADPQMQALMTPVKEEFIKRDWIL